MQANPAQRSISKLFSAASRRLTFALLIFLGRFENGFSDGAVGAAPANVAAEPFSNLFPRGHGILAEQSFSCHDLSRRAITALRADMRTNASCSGSNCSPLA